MTEVQASRPKSQMSLVERRRKVWDMKLKGWSTKQIAEKLGLSYQTIVLDLKRTAQQVDATRWLEGEGNMMFDQLNMMLRRYLKPALQGDIESGNFVLKIMERKAKLLGLDAPKRVDVRAMIVEWAMAEGLDPQDVIDVALDMLPKPGD